MTQIKGTIKVINDTEVISEKFSKRNFVVTTDDMYQQDIQMQFTQDKCAIIDRYKVNDRVCVDINIRGREWINKEDKAVYFVTLEAWKINKEDSMATDSQPKPVPNAPTEEDEDLPF